MKIITNHNWRQFNYRDEVPADVLESQFDWMKDDKGDWPTDDYVDGFFCYRGHWYHLSEFMRSACPEGWHGGKADSFFSGVAIKLSDDGEEFQVATYIA
jgi:hypothetical protein